MISDLSKSNSFEVQSWRFVNDLLICVTYDSATAFYFAYDSLERVCFIVQVWPKGKNLIRFLRGNSPCVGHPVSRSQKISIERPLDSSSQSLWIRYVVWVGPYLEMYGRYRISKDIRIYANFTLICIFTSVCLGSTQRIPTDRQSRYPRGNFIEVVQESIQFGEQSRECILNNLGFLEAIL